MRHAMIWTNDDQAHWCIYAPSDLTWLMNQLERRFGELLSYPRGDGF